MATFTDISDPILDLSTTPLRDSSIENVSWYEYQPPTPDARQNLEISVTNTDQYTLPSEAYLQVCGKLVKAAAGNAAFAPADVIGLVNNGVLALFSNASYWINDIEVESINTHVDIATTILGLVRYSDDYTKTTGTSFFWAKDTSTSADIAPYVLDTSKVTGDNANYNKGLHIRHSLLNTGYFEAIIPLSHIFGFARDVRKVFYGVKHMLRLQRRPTDDEAIYRADAVADAKVTLTKCSLWMPTVRPALKYLTGLTEWIEQGRSSTLYWQATRVEASEDKNGLTDFSWSIVRSSSEQPRHIFIAFQKTDRRNSQTGNPMIFDALGLTKISLIVNAVRVPQSDLDINYGERRFLQAYKMISDYMGRDQNVDTGNQISSEDFRTLYPIYHFDLENQPETLKDSTSDIQIRATIGANAGSYRAYAVIQCDRTMLLSSDGRKMNLTSSN